MTPIESTYANAVGYQDEILAIYFTNGSLYYYLAVPELIFNRRIVKSSATLRVKRLQ